MDISRAKIVADLTRCEAERDQMHTELERCREGWILDKQKRREAESERDRLLKWLKETNKNFGQIEVARMDYEIAEIIGAKPYFGTIWEDSRKAVANS